VIEYGREGGRGREDAGVSKELRGTKKEKLERGGQRNTPDSSAVTRPVSHNIIDNHSVWVRHLSDLQANPAGSVVSLSCQRERAKQPFQQEQEGVCGGGGIGGCRARSFAFELCGFKPLCL
jgi:hypothetical protein